jgi:D-amino-acid dehydrogenase
MLDPDSPLYIQPRPDPKFVRWLVEFLAASRKKKYDRGVAALVELCRVSIDMWEQVAKRSAESFGFERHGLLSVYENAASIENATGAVELARKSGVRAERWTADRIRTEEPAVVGPQVGGYFYPDDAHCEPYGAVKALAEEAKALGVKFLEWTEVYNISGTGGPRRLTTTRGEITASQIVVATGPWSEALGAMLGLRLPVIGAKGYSIVLPPATPHPTRSIYLIERKIAVNPHRHALRLAGTLELVRNDFSINARRVDAILRGAKGMLNIGETPVPREIWRGLRPCTPDGMPMIGRARGHADVWLATGHQMAGTKAAPGTGVLLAQLMAGEKPSFDPEPFRADRY